MQPDLEQGLLAGFESRNFMRHLGVEITVLEQGVCDMALDHRDSLMQHGGRFDSAVLGALADMAAGTAGQTLMPAGERCRTAEYKLNLLAAAEGARLEAEARIVKAGRTLKVAETNVYCINESERKHVAMALVTLVADGTPRQEKDV
ncbi:hypothetical protein GCM10007924_29550 [Sneathiella chinensis]|uniref:Thioesterase domain-containing protein n=2 Tax=Sneathiella chinensis TaxID=349750 RepID=A0ABQ5U906_9PROT|nr:hypothetical protein GCM10007924_29550 [Sneathiella chinensis]